MRILITRPLAQARKTAQVLQKQHHKAVCFPLLRIIQNRKNIEKLQHFNPSDFAAVVVSSRNAYEALSRLKNSSLKIYVVGQGMQKFLEENSFANVKSAEDVVQLSALIKAGSLEPVSCEVLQKQNLSGNIKAKILYLCGNVVTQDLQTLLGKNFDVEKLEVYKSNLVKKLNSEALNALAKNEIDAVLFYSARTANAFADVVKKHSLYLKKITAYCLSQKVADQVQTMDWKDIKIAKHPNQESLLELLI